MHWDLSQFTGKDVVFVGRGRGRALDGLQRFLEKHGDLKSFAAVDKSDDTEPLAFLLQYDRERTVFIKNDPIPVEEMPVPYITPLQLFFSLVTALGATTVGITGTKGKSTTTALTAHVLQQAGKDVILAGNIGVSPFIGLETATAQSIFVLELSSYQLVDMNVSPHISACVNLYNDHTLWHGSIENYWEAKHNIMRFATAQDLFVYNPSFPTLQQWVDEASCRTKAITVDEPLDLSGSQLFGDHNRLNALIAREICRELGVSDQQFMTGLNSFKPLTHRMQFIATKNEVAYIDDAIGMTPESTLASLTAVTEKFGPVGCLLLGGQDRDYDFTLLMQRLADQAIPALVLFPNTVQKMRAALPDRYTPEILETSSMSEAVSWAATKAPAGSVVLLSTAAPSYSLWSGFEEKGDQFQAAVASL